MAAEGKKAPERLWHDLIFYTSGEVTRLMYRRDGQTDYQHYGEATGVYARGAQRWGTLLAAVRPWKLFVEEGRGNAEARTTALRALARSL